MYTILRKPGGGRNEEGLMTRKFWTVVVASLCIICLASVADAQRRAKPTRGLHAGNDQNQNPSNQDANPGNGHQGENPGNGNQGETPEDPPNGTPDGSTPAEEDTCDGLKYGTPGLYGLCIAFCEAHDCIPTFNEAGELDLSSCKKNDRKILDKYRSKMVDGDSDMPCLPATQANEDPLTACPCWSRDQLSKFPYSLYGSNIEGSELMCDLGATWQIATRGGEPCEMDVDYVGETLALSDGTTVFVDLQLYGSGCGDANCQGFFGCNPEDGCPDWFTTSDVYVNLTEEEYLNCRDQIQQLQPYCD
jgi:hypothetical protein